MSARSRKGAGSGPAWPQKIQLLIDDKRLREQTFSKAEVAALWRKATETARDASLPGLSIDSAIRLAYDAGHVAALALLAAHGLRPGGGQGHHELAFYGAAAFGDPGLADLVPDSEEIRRIRHGSMYDPVIAGPDERADALAWVAHTLPAIRAALVRLDSRFDVQLEKV
ncbi:MAG TPA: hypothetical protein VFK04_19925 [Gemmatimonadaceae bacterium]|nr:hypothetical protein [Gemmatimonadaceae bacterium]